MTSCLNCGAELHGKYCHDCGQKATAHRLRFRDVWHDATHEFIHLDENKILNTIKLLFFKPGLLTQEYIKGRRVRYITPLRLYLTFSVIFFAVAALQPPGEGIARSNIRGTTAEDEKIADQLGDTIMHTIPRTMFVLIPLYGLITWSFYWKSQRLYIPHLYYSIHFHAFACSVLSLGVGLGLTGDPGKIIGALLLLTIVPWHYVALRRVFGGTRWMTFAKGTFIAILYWIVLGAAMLLMVWTALPKAKI